MNIDRLRRHCERLDRRRWQWYRRWCWFHHVNHEMDFEIKTFVVLTGLACLITAWLTLIWAGQTVSVAQIILLIAVPLAVMSLLYISGLGTWLFEWLDRLTESIHNYYERRLEVVEECLKKTETAAADHQALVDEWAGVPDGAIMPARLEAELADRGLSLAEQLQLP